MDLEKKIMEYAAEKRQFKSKEIAVKFDVSRQYAHMIIAKLVKEKKLLKFGSTRSAFYGHPHYIHSVTNKVKRHLINENLEEHKVLEKLEKNSSTLNFSNEDVRSIYHYAFSEMLNNAIDHSKSKKIDVDVGEENGEFVFHVNDFGIGVFRNVMGKKKLQSELEAIQELLKGKTTTQPTFHTGEGIFFTSKIADYFTLESYGYKLTVDNKINDVFVEEVESRKKGTLVSFSISMNSKKHLSNIFKEYGTNSEDITFDKTTIQIRLYTMGTIYISRSQARRVMANLEKFNEITLDFDRVPTVGQAFADEIFRVFQNKYSHIKIIPINMNKAVDFMVKRAINGAD